MCPYDGVGGITVQVRLAVLARRYVDVVYGTVDEYLAKRGVIMTYVDHYGIAEELVGESVQGAGTMSGREVAKAQVHATLALAEILRAISAELTMIRVAALTMSTPPGR